MVPPCHAARHGDAPWLAAVARHDVQHSQCWREERPGWSGDRPRSHQLVHVVCPPFTDTRPALPSRQPPPAFSGHMQATQHLTCLVVHEAGPTQPPGRDRERGRGEMCSSPSLGAEPLSPLPAPPRPALVWNSPLQGLSLEAVAKHLLWFHRALRPWQGSVQPPQCCVAGTPSPRPRCTCLLRADVSLLPSLGPEWFATSTDSYILRDLDDTSVVEDGRKKLNTLAHYKVNLPALQESFASLEPAWPQG